MTSNKIEESSTFARVGEVICQRTCANEIVQYYKKK